MFCGTDFTRKMGRVARFGDNLKAIRDELSARRGTKVNQKELASYLKTDAGEEMTQSGLSKLELIEFSPKPTTVDRLAQGLAPLLNQSEQEVHDRLLDGVLSRYDAVQAKRANEDDRIQRIRELMAALPKQERDVVWDAIEHAAIEAVKVNKRGA